jgi:phospholipid/cholesterol/gamma-HCH transport system ATP-binding protein
MNSVMGIGEYILFLYKGEKFWEGSNKDMMRSDVEALNNFVFASPVMKSAKASMGQ